MRHPCFQPLPIALAVLAASAALAAQSTRVQDLGLGKLVVARRNAPDPIFAETVILLVRYENGGTVGLALNRRSKVPVSQALEGLNGSKQRSEPVFSGGPVEPAGVLVLLRANTVPEGADHVIGKVYLVSSKALLEKTLAGKAGPNDLRVYVGYTGWAGGQLESEIKRGFWSIFTGSADLAFDPDPDSLWSRLIGKEDQPIAGVKLPALAFARDPAGIH
ncbi:MAG TPA: YqgE/AlgH family protein [Bryobacteraceae bacterium]|nr:YqgE/AlgH family protein [Bryobacteraceae bacterium]